MAATNFTPIQLFHSTTASAAPTAGTLANGELAINITDGKLFYKDNGGVVQVLATKGTGSIGGSTTQIQYNNAGALAGSAAMTFNSGTNTVTLTTLNLTNALGATHGGTAQSTYTQGDILYSSATNTLAKLGIGTANFILTSSGSVPQWVAPTSITVQTANNLAGGLAGSLPYQSAVDTTTFLAIGAANRVLTSTGTAPQWVTSLTGLTGVTSSSLTNTSLTSGRVVLSTAGGQQTDDADLTFDGTTLSAGGLSVSGFSTQVRTVTLGNSNFNGAAIFAPSTPAKLYIGTGVVTDITSAAASTNTIGAISSLAITPVAATNANVTYTNAATLYIAGAPSASTNVTITNPYSLYIAAGAAYFGGGLTFAGQLNVTDTTDSSSTTTGSIVTAGGVGIAKKLFVGLDANIYGITVGRGAGAVATNTAVGASALNVNNTGSENVGLGFQALRFNTSGSSNTAVGVNALSTNSTGGGNTAIGRDALLSNTTGSTSTAVGYQTGYSNSTGRVTAVGYAAAFSNTTGGITAVGWKAGYANTTGVCNTAVGNSFNLFAPLEFNTTGNNNSAFGEGALAANTTASNNTAVGFGALYLNTTASNNTAVGYQAGYSNTTGTNLVALGYQAGYGNTTANNNISIGYQAQQITSTGENNIAIGTIAMALNTTGASNVAIGTQALGSNTTASNNTAVGYQAMYSTQTGGSHAALGYQALYSITQNVAGSVAFGFQAGQATTTGSVTALGTVSLYSNTTGASNVAVGNSALYASTTSSNNVAVGDASLRFNTTGASNTALGTNALRSNTTSSNSTAVGKDAGYLNTTGDRIVAVGFQALYNNTTGNQNEAFGSYSLFSNSVGVRNTGVGDQSGYYITGSDNTAIGFGALIGSAGTNSGSLNTALGAYSLFTNSTGSNNTALGAEAMRANTTGSNNTIVGDEAAYNNTTGANNTAVGTQALRSNTTASNNTAVGYQAGYSNTTGPGGTFLGYQAGYNATTGAYNCFVGLQAGISVTTGTRNTILGGYSGNQGGLDIRTLSNHIVLSDGDGNPRGVFSSSGNFLVGNTADPSSTVAGTLIGLSGPGGRMILANTITATYQGVVSFINGNGTVGEINTSGSSTSYVTSSDYRLKNTITPMTGALAKVSLLKPCTYKWNADGSDGEGFIAHELAEVCPDAVAGTKDAVDENGNPKYQGIDTSFLVATLTAAIQEQQTIIESLKARLDAANL